MAITYITVQQFCAYHECDTLIVEELIEHGVVAQQQQQEIVMIPDSQIQRLEKALRLYTELGVNAAGIDIILNLLDRLGDPYSSDIDDLTIG